jgi:hypothetical protein
MQGVFKGYVGMTREKIITELNHRATQKYLVYLALQEIMLDYYEDVSSLKFFDLDLKTKHKNIINALKRKSTQAYSFLQGYENGDATIKQFHEIVTLFEKLHNSIDMGGDVFHKCLNQVEDIIKSEQKKL